MDTLIDKFCQEMPRFKIHIYNIFNQLDHYRALKENLRKTEALIHIEFSENFQCKLSKEIQGMACILVHLKDRLLCILVCTTQKQKTFCAVSDSVQHDPSGIWAFLDPLLDKLLDQHPDVETIHFFSEWAMYPVQTKRNFFLFITGDV